MKARMALVPGQAVGALTLVGMPVGLALDLLGYPKTVCVAGLVAAQLTLVLCTLLPKRR